MCVRRRLLLCAPLSLAKNPKSPIDVSVTPTKQKLVISVTPKKQKLSMDIVTPTTRKLDVPSLRPQLSERVKVCHPVKNETLARHCAYADHNVEPPPKPSATLTRRRPRGDQAGVGLRTMRGVKFTHVPTECNSDDCVECLVRSKLAIGAFDAEVAL